MSKILILLILILFSVQVASASLADEAGKSMVAGGIKYAFGDAAADLNPDNSSNMSMIAKEYQPWKNPGVKTMIQDTGLLVLLVEVIFLLLGVYYVSIKSRSSDAGKLIDFAFNRGDSFDLRKYVEGMAGMIVSYLFVLTFLVAIVLIAQMWTDMIDTSTLTLLSTSSQSGYLDLLNAVMRFIFWIFNFIRIIIITLIFGLSVLLAVARYIPMFRNSINKIGVYFFFIAMMQPVMVSVAYIALSTDEYLTSTGWIISATVVDIAVIVVQIVLAGMFLWGPSTIYKYIDAR